MDKNGWVALLFKTISRTLHFNIYRNMELYDLRGKHNNRMLKSWPTLKLNISILYYMSLAIIKCIVITQFCF